MIRLTRLNGSELALNPDLVHRAEETPDTVLTLIDGSRYVVREPVEEIIERIVGFRARVVAQAGLLADGVPEAPAATAASARRGHPDVSDELDYDDRGASVVRLRARRG